MIIIHASQDFTKRLQCDVSMEGQRIEQPGRLLSWSAHVFRIGPTPFLLFMNDASLSAILAPAKEIRRYGDVVQFLLERIRKLWVQHGREFDPTAHPVMVLPRTNRSLMGSMNEAIHAIRFHHEWSRKGGPPFNCLTMENQLNTTPYKAINYAFPREFLGQLLAESEG